MKPRTPPDRQQAWDYLLNVLSRQAYTVAELRTKLARRKVPEALSEELIARLIELRLVDDASYAEQYVTSRSAFRGRLALRTELRRKGVEEELIEKQVGRLSAQQQLSSAIELLRKHAWRYRPADTATGADQADTRPDADRTENTRSIDDRTTADEYEALNRVRRAEAKARSFLARRGFSPDVVIAAVDEVGWFSS